MITNREEGKGKPPRLFPKTGYPLGYPEPDLQQQTEARDIYGQTSCVVDVGPIEMFTCGLTVNRLEAGWRFIVHVLLFGSL